MGRGILLPLVPFLALLLFVLMKLVELLLWLRVFGFPVRAVFREGGVDGGDAKSAKVRGCAKRVWDGGLGHVDGEVEAMVAAADGGWWGA